jgi:hypothetical protein
MYPNAHLLSYEGLINDSTAELTLAAEFLEISPWKTDVYIRDENAKYGVSTEIPDSVKAQRELNKSQKDL